MISEYIAAIIIKNSKGELFVHKRRSDKERFPNLYGLGAGGKKEKNESVADAAERELFEETKLKTPVKLLFTIPYEDNENRSFISVFETKTDQRIACDDSEWQWSGWMTYAEVQKLRTENKLSPDTASFYDIYRSHLV